MLACIGLHSFSPPRCRAPHGSSSRWPVPPGQPG
jgi:hypothetical protein